MNRGNRIRAKESWQHVPLCASDQRSHEQCAGCFWRARARRATAHAPPWRDVFQGFEMEADRRSRICRCFARTWRTFCQSDSSHICNRSVRDSPEMHREIRAPANVHAHADAHISRISRQASPGNSGQFDALGAPPKPSSSELACCQRFLEHLFASSLEFEPCLAALEARLHPENQVPLARHDSSREPAPCLLRCPVCPSVLGTIDKQGWG